MTQSPPLSPRACFRGDSGFRGHGTARSHEDVGASVGQPQTHQTSADQHRRRQQDRDGFGDANQRTEYEIPHHRCQLTHGITETETSAPGQDKEKRSGWKH